MRKCLYELRHSHICMLSFNHHTFIFIYPFTHPSIHPSYHTSIYAHIVYAIMIIISTPTKIRIRIRIPFLIGISQLRAFLCPYGIVSLVLCLSLPDGILTAPPPLKTYCESGNLYLGNWGQSAAATAKEGKQIKLRRL